MIKSIKKAFTVGALVAAGLGFSSAAHAQLTFQGVTFTPSWSGNVLTLEIDAANPTGDWADADFIGAIQIKDIGNWSSVTMTGPGAANSWTIVGEELTANGCDGGMLGIQRLCASGTNVALTDDMIFTFTFTGGTQDFSSPFIKVLMFDEANSTQKLGSLMSMEVPAIPEPSTYAMLLGGLGIIAVARKRAKNAA